MSNLAATLVAPDQIVLCETPPRQPEKGEVLLEIQYAGICGTDVALWRGHYPVPLPLVLGHEFSARVVSAGPDVDPRWIGKRVTCEINNSCIAYGSSPLCEACKRGMPNHCLTRTVTGIIKHPGAFANWLTVPVGNLHELPDEISDELAIFIEPLAAAIRTFELTPIVPGDWVLVLGSGRLGRLISVVAKRLGARVITVARSCASLEFVRAYSDASIQMSTEKAFADFARQIGSMDELRSYVHDLTNGMGADIVVEATGQNSILDAAASLARPQGTVCLKSTSGLPVKELNSTLHTVNEIRFQGSRCGPFDKAIQFMLKHKIPDKSWISSLYPLSEIQPALLEAESAPKVVLSVTV